MLKRIGLVAWWFGALIGIVGAASGLLASGDRIPIIGVSLLFGTLPAWVLSFVLAGSFWKPPRLPQ